MHALEQVWPRIAARQGDPNAAHGDPHLCADLQESETDGGGLGRGQFGRLQSQAAQSAHQHAIAEFQPVSGYLVMALLAGTCKVRLPRLTSTISVSFVIILVAIAELGYAEAIWLSASVAVVQTLWRARRQPKPIRIAFNTANLVLSTSAAFFVCRTVLDLAPSGLLPVLLMLATALLYASNSAMVAAVLCLAEDKPMRDIWQQCYFWSFPYYLVGAAVSGLMVATVRSAGWPFSFLVLPILTMIYISYRLQTSARPEATCA